MDVESWKSLWQMVFFLGSALFYATVVVIAVQGSGDIVAMIRKMTSGHRES